MKLFKLSTIIALCAFFALFMVACDEDSTTNPTNTTPTKPAAPTNLRATSIDATSITIKWDHSTDYQKTGFAYDLVVSGLTNPIKITDLTKNTYTITGLTEGTKYTFSLSSVLNDTNFCATAAEVSWSPAQRFIENVNEGEIRIYETASNDFGSGLVIYDTDSDPAGSDPAGPNTVKKGFSEFWNFAIYTTGDVLKIGSPTKLGYDFDSEHTPGVTQVLAPITGIASLDDVFDSEAFDTKAASFIEQYFDLSQYNSNLCFIVRYHENSQTLWNYAKILVRYINNSYLQGTAPNRYIVCQVSHQKVAGVPYCKVAPKN